MNAIETENLTKIYRSKLGKKLTTAVSDLNLSLEEGSFVGLLGPNGAGKTTLVKTLLDIVKPSAGTAKILGANIGDYKVKSRIGYLPENHRFPQYLTAEQVLRYFGKFTEPNPAVLERRISELFEIVSLKKWRKVKLKVFSKGMIQRLGLAQAMINDPDLLILDEPTDGVDPVGRKEIRDLLLELKNRGKTIFLNSHLLSEVEMVVDKVVILDKGKIVREGSVKELTEKTKYYRILFVKSATELPAMDVIKGVKATKQTEKSLEIVAESYEDLNKALDAFRSKGIIIKSVEPMKATLEDIFISLIKKEEGGLQ